MDVVVQVLARPDAAPELVRHLALALEQVRLEVAQLQPQLLQHAEGHRVKRQAQPTPVTEQSFSVFHSSICWTYPTSEASTFDVEQTKQTPQRIRCPRIKLLLVWPGNQHKMHRRAGQIIGSPD